MNNIDLIHTFSLVRPSSTFLSIRDYNNSSNEIANFTIAFHINYHNALLKSLEIAKNYNAEKDELKLRAKNEVITSLQKSLDNYKIPLDKKDDGYERFKDADGNFIKGIKKCIKTNELHIYGFVVHKEVIRPGTYKVVNSAPLTIAKDAIRKTFPIGKFRQFCLKNNNFSTIRVDRFEIENFNAF